MGLKDKLLNKIADFVDKYKTPEYDIIDNCMIKGSVRAIRSGDRFSQILPNKAQNGLIDMKKLLDDEFGNSRSQYNTISFCDKGNVIAICNIEKSGYEEIRNESFDYCNEDVYVVCKNKEEYESVKKYVLQNKDYHLFYEDVLDIPRKNAFNQAFKVGEYSDIKEEQHAKEELQESQEININKNYVKLDGEIKKIGKPFRTRDGYDARFIEVTQHYERNGKLKTNDFSVMLEGNVFNEYQDKINLKDKVLLSGAVSTYLDKNNNQQFAINCYELEVLDRSSNQDKGQNR